MEKNKEKGLCEVDCNIDFIPVPLSRKGWSGIAHIGLLDLNIQSLPKYDLFLSEEEIRLYERIKFEARQKSFLSGRLVAKKTISLILGENNLKLINIKPGVFNQPLVEYRGQLSHLKISLSHHKYQSGCLVFPHEHPMGFDLEKITTNAVSSISSQMTVHEKSLLTIDDIEFNEFYTFLWTIKEALSKVLITGLTVPMEIYEIAAMQKKGNFYISTFKNFLQYKAISFNSGSNVYSFVLPEKSECELDMLIAYILK